MSNKTPKYSFPQRVNDAGHQPSWIDVYGDIIDLSSCTLMLVDGLEVSVNWGDADLMLQAPESYTYANHMFRQRPVAPKPVRTEPKKVQVHIAGVYHEDDNISLGVFTSVDVARAIADSMVYHNAELAPYTHTLTLDVADINDMHAKIDRMIESKS